MLILLLLPSPLAAASSPTAAVAPEPAERPLAIDCRSRERVERLWYFVRTESPLRVSPCAPSASVRSVAIFCVGLWISFTSSTESKQQKRKLEHLRLSFYPCFLFVLLLLSQAAATPSSCPLERSKKRNLLLLLKEQGQLRRTRREKPFFFDPASIP